METLETLKQQREAINRQIRDLEQKILEEIQAKAASLGYAVVRNGMPPAERTKPKYSDGNGNTWSGKGRKPLWLQQALEEGRNLEDFAA
jgi:DNA-binding protein H-NS